MYSVGDYAVNKNFGVSKISDIRKLDGLDGEFYMMSPVNNPSTEIGVPVSTAKDFIRSLMSKEEAEYIVENCDSIEHEYKAETQRAKSEEYRAMFLSMEPKEWLCLLKEMRKTAKKRGMRGMGNTEYLKKGEDMLFSELAFVLKETPLTLKTKVFNTLKEKNQ